MKAPFLELALAAAFTPACGKSTSAVTYHWSALKSSRPHATEIVPGRVR